MPGYQQGETVEWVTCVIKMAKLLPSGSEIIGQTLKADGTE